MARAVKEEEHTEKRNAILDAARRFLYTKGYEQMTIQDIMDDLQISKGAFYHYFDSKQALLEALVERMMDEGLQTITPITHDPQLPALEKFQRFFDTLTRWKVARKDFFLALLHVWYTDDNAIVRQKMLTNSLKSFTPLLALIIRQGIEEGVMKTSHPDQIGEVVISLAQSLGDAIGTRLLTFDPSRDNFQDIERLVAAYTESLERTLGVSASSLHLIESETLREWFSAPEEA
jgi:AcrR family transcriptional regulator